MMKRITRVKECDARGDDSSNKAGLIKIIWNVNLKSIPKNRDAVQRLLVIIKTLLLMLFIF